MTIVPVITQSIPLGNITGYTTSSPAVPIAAVEIQQLSSSIGIARGSIYQRAEISNISISDGKISLSLRLIIGGVSNLTRNISISRISLTPTPLPLGWNGSSWVYGDDEARCLANYSYMEPSSQDH
jgi:hypothetical protein